MPRPDIVTERMLLSLSDEWMDLEDLFTIIIPLVAPGKALRKYQMNQDAWRRRNPTGECRSSLLTEDEQIASGARTICYDRVSGQANSKKIEVEKLPDGSKRVRLAAPMTESCPACRRPFVQPTAEKKSPPPPEKPRDTVLYPNFPSWDVWVEAIL